VAREDRQNHCAARNLALRDSLSILIFVENEDVRGSIGFALRENKSSNAVRI